MKHVPLLLLLAGCAQILGISDPHGDACSPFDVNTCSLSDTCDLDADGLLACRPEGGLGEYALCDQVGDTCAGGMTCDFGVCRQFCDGTHGCTRTGEASCSVNDGSLEHCDDACDVFAGTGCTGTLECHPDRDEVSNATISMCTPPGYFGDNASGVHCDQLNACAVGLGCDDLAGGSHTCLPLCHHDGTDCAGTCVEVGRLHETIDLGVCRP